MARMNSSSLYVTTNQIILKAEPSNPSTWQDLYRLVPYLRNSLCCVVCGNLLIDPMTPAPARCQHHVCRRCKFGRKKIKPACSWCKDCTAYNENKCLKILLQCYKNMCYYLLNSPIYAGLLEQASQTDATGVERGAANLIQLVKEGAAFQDSYESSGGLPKSAYSILPCVYTNSSTQTLQNTQNTQNTSSASEAAPVVVPTVPTRPPLYSVLYPGAGNKITIKRKAKEEVKQPVVVKKELIEKAAVFKKPPAKCTTKPKRGCRCGNATATPGKLTCCGQRCPCYVDSKACIECKCRGCRNPHRPDGNKVRPHIPEIQYISQTQQGQNIVGHTEILQRLEDIVKVSVVTGDYDGLQLLKGPLLTEDEDDAEITVV